MGKNQLKQFSWNVIIVIAGVLLTMSCGEPRNGTHPKYKYNVSITKEEYAADSTYLYYALEAMLEKHKKPFLPSNYYNSSTKIYVDSVLYSPDKMRLIVFVIYNITKNDIKSKEDDKVTSVYNANYLFCKRDSPGSKIKIFEYNAFNLDNYNSYKDIKYALNDLCFIKRATERWNNKEWKYNLDDVRFWNSSEYNMVTSRNKFFELVH